MIFGAGIEIDFDNNRLAWRFQRGALASGETRARILAAACELGYQPNGPARSLTTQQSGQPVTVREPVEAMMELA